MITSSIPITPNEEVAINTMRAVFQFHKVMTDIGHQFTAEEEKVLENIISTESEKIKSSISDVIKWICKM